MSSFVTYGLNGHELMPINQVFKRPMPERTAAIKPAPAIEERTPPDSRHAHDPRRRAEEAYHAVERLRQELPVVVAEQIMVAPVTTITLEARISDALEHFQREGFRHLPVVTAAGRLVGILSDRDVLRRLAGLSLGDLPPVPRDHSDETVEHLMAPRVLTATVDTDVRYIARLFVEQRIGAVPIMQEQRLVGITTRSDVLRAVVRHYALELWV